MNAVNVPDTHPTCDHTVHDAVTDCPDSYHPSLVSMMTVMIGTFSSFLTLVYRLHVIEMSSSAFLCSEYCGQGRMIFRKFRSLRNIHTFKGIFEITFRKLNYVTLHVISMKNGDDFNDAIIIFLFFLGGEGRC